MSDYEEFVRTQLPHLSRYSVMLTGDHDLAADLVQDVLEKVFRQWSRISATDRPEHYVLKMITNEYFSWRRRWAVRTIVSVGELPEQSHPDDAATMHAARDEMWNRLATLPNRQRAVMVLRYYQHLTDVEISDVLGCSPTSVRGYAHRALTTLRTNFANHLTTRNEGAR